MHVRSCWVSIRRGACRATAELELQAIAMDAHTEPLTDQLRGPASEFPARRVQIGCSQPESVLAPFSPVAVQTEWRRRRLEMGAMVTFEVVSPQSWSGLEALFEARGGPSHCWCMVWRNVPANLRRTKGAERRRVMKCALHDLVNQGLETGIIARVDDCPAGWVSVAPLETLRPMHGQVGLPEPEQNPWAIVCFFIASRFRGRGLMPRLLNEAISHARESGASVIEAFPVDRDAPSYRFMGYVDMFENAGFRDMGMAGSRRHVMRLDLAGTGGP